VKIMATTSSQPTANQPAKKFGIEIPTLAEITELYKAASKAKDERMIQVAENAVFRLAAAEAAAAEAFTLVRFSHSVK
jgi:hypothetical protein